jgi:hypothetical protein
MECDVYNTCSWLCSGKFAFVMNEIKVVVVCTVTTNIFINYVCICNVRIPLSVTYIGLNCIL